jgi:ATP-dependent Clp protease ATP-binding subunit ClpC
VEAADAAAGPAGDPPSRPRPAVTVDAMRRQFGAATGLPGHLLDETQALPPAALREWFASRLLGQPEAVDAVCRALLKFQAGLHDPRRPLAVLLFAGPTGTGKTQLAKLLGDFLFPHRPPAERLVRLDMSEYAGHAAAARLLGEPFGEPSDLVKRLRRNPFGVVLFDEIEKASPEVFDNLMGVFDEGRFTDALGRVTWFRSCVLIMTSNLGTRSHGALGFGAPDDPAAARSDPAAIARHFRPEFFNRIDQVVHFQPLDRAAIEAIVRRELAALETREGLARRALTLVVADDLFRLVCDRGFDPLHGARPLQRRIEELVVTPLARWLVAHPAAAATTLFLAADGSVRLAAAR